MPFKTTINITDGSVCATSYGIEIKKSSDMFWQPLENQLSLPIVVENLQDSTDYNVRITRNCCNGTVSDPVIVNITGVVAQPRNFTSEDIGGNDVYLEWDAAPLADNYVLERATSPDFVSGLTTVYSGSGTDYTDTVPGSGSYYYRIVSQQTGYQDSSYVYSDVIVS